MKDSQLQASAWPIGAVIAWFGSLTNSFDSTGRGINKMTGWALCNSKNGTPDLQDRFIVGAGHNYSPDQKGGNESITLTVNHLPAHKHTIIQNGSHTHKLNIHVNASIWGGGVAGDITSWGNNEQTTTAGGEHSHDMNTTGNNAPFDILPPFYALYYIMRIE